MVQKFHGIQMVGKFISQKLSSLPTYTANDEGRLIYNTTNKKIYIGDDSS